MCWKRKQTKVNHVGMAWQASASCFPPHHQEITFKPLENLVPLKEYSAKIVFKVEYNLNSRDDLTRETKVHMKQEGACVTPVKWLNSVISQSDDTCIHINVFGILLALLIIPLRD